MSAASGPNSVEDGLVLALDAGNTKSYPGSGTAWTNLIGSNNGTLTNGPTYNSDNGGYLQFPNSNSYIQLSSPVLTTPSTFSVEVWVKIIDTSVYSRFLSNRDANTDGWEVGFGPTNKWYLQINSGVSNFASAPSNQDQWYHVAWNFDGAYSKIFVDGVRVKTVHHGSQTINTTTASTIGAISYQTSSVQNKFKIAKLRVYNRELTEAEILQNYNATRGRYVSYLTSIVTSGLTLHLDAANTSSYPGSGTTWTDLMGNTNGTLTNGPTFSSDNGGSIVFDGSNDSVEITSGWTNFGTEPFSMEVWYRPHTANTYETLVGNIDSGFQLDWNGSNMRFNSSTKVTSTISFVANVWKQVVVVREGTGTDQFKIYSDGDLNTTSTLNVDFNQTSQLRLGKSRNGSYKYDGNISVVRIYRGKALTAAEVLQNYNATRGRYVTPTIVQDGLILHLDAANTNSYSGSGTTWTDLSGNSNNGTLTNGPTFSTDNGGVIVFDGSNDYVDVSGSTTVSAATFLAWIRLDDLSQTSYTGIVFSRNPSGSISGMNFYSATENIGYHWNDASNTYSWDSGLTVPDQEWCMVALTVSSSSATAYLFRSSGMTSATNSVSHGSTTLDAIKVGADVPTNRYLDGRIGVAMVYNKALTESEVEQNYNALKGRYLN